MIISGMIGKLTTKRGLFSAVSSSFRLSTVTASNTTSDALQLVWSHDVMATDNLLLVSVHHNYNSAASISVTCDGMVLTRVIRVVTGAASQDRIIELWSLSNPPIGTVSLRVSSPSPVSIMGCGMSFENADPVNPLATPATRTVASASTITTTAEMVPGSIVIALGSGRGTVALGVGGDQTVVASRIAGTNTLGSVTTQTTGSSTFTGSSGQPLAIIAVAVKGA